MTDLDRRLLCAHERRDTSALVSLYMQAADQADDADAAGFYITHAYVFALELGDARQEPLRKWLVAAGREV